MTETLDSAAVVPQENSTFARARRLLGRVPWRLVRLVIGLVLLFIVVRGFDWSHFGEILAEIHPIYVVIALAISVANLMLSALRWGTLLRAENVQVPLLTLARYYLVSLFFNNFLPPFVGADAVRMISLHESKSPGVRVVSVLIERVFGIAALLAFGTVAVLAAPGLRQYTSLVVLVVGAALAVAVGLVLLLVPELWLWATGWLRRFARPYRILMDIGQAGKFYRRHRRALLLTALISVVIQTLVVLSFQVRALAFGVDISFAQTMLVAPAITLLTLIPISPGGLGTQEAFFSLVYGTIGISPDVAVAMSLLARLVDLALGVAGGILWVRSRG